MGEGVQKIKPLSTVRVMRANAFLSNWTADDFADSAHNNAEWRNSAKDMWARHGFPTLISQNRRAYTTFNYAPPRTRASCDLHRYGNEGEGGKIACSMNSLPSSCIIYSLGSHDIWDFEEAMLKSTHCIIHTFDCSTEGAKKPSDPRVVFHKQCLGHRNVNKGDPNSAGLDPALFWPLEELAAQNGHTRIDFLKMDIEGGEYAIFEQLVAKRTSAALVLPDQICFELHLPEDGGQPELPPEKFWSLWSNVLDLGYSVISREDNYLCPHCAEFTLVRTAPGA